MRVSRSALRLRRTGDKTKIVALSACRVKGHGRYFTGLDAWSDMRGTVNRVKLALRGNYDGMQPMTLSVDGEQVANRLLLALPPAALEELLPKFKRHDLPLGRVLYRPGDQVHQAYFVNRGLVSLIKRMQDGRTVEVNTRGIFCAHPRSAGDDTGRAASAHIGSGRGVSAGGAYPLSAWANAGQRLGGAKKAVLRVLRGRAAADRSRL